MRYMLVHPVTEEATFAGDLPVATTKYSKDGVVSATVTLMASQSCRQKMKSQLIVDTGGLLPISTSQLCFVCVKLKNLLYFINSTELLMMFASLLIIRLPKKKSFLI